MQQPIIKTKKFILRPLKKTDAPSMVKHANDKAVSHFLAGTFPSPYLLSDAVNFINHNTNEIAKGNPHFLTFGIVVDGEVAGTFGVYFNDNRRGAEICFWLGKKYWGRGIMTQAIKKISEYCFNKLKLRRLEARFMTRNKASRIILEKNKFNVEGVLKKALIKNNKTYNLVLMSRVK